MPTSSPLSPEDLERHARHIMLKEIGGPGLQRLKAASVSIVGAGALGGPCALFLAAAGVGRIEIWDDDVVERSNLQRQVQFSDADRGGSKAEMLGSRL
ncbi:MAG: ThiF family adenylyltransferase, partial [Pseudomonadota bacterium]